MASIIQNMETAEKTPVFVEVLGHQTGGASTAQGEQKRTCASGDASPVLLGEVCAEVLGTLFPKTFPSGARFGSFPDATCRNVSHKKISHPSEVESKIPGITRVSEPGKMERAKRLELSTASPNRFAAGVMHNHENGLFPKMFPHENSPRVRESSLG